jgi:hypothetical protein
VATDGSVVLDDEGDEDQNNGEALFKSHAGYNAPANLDRTIADVFSCDETKTVGAILSAATEPNIVGGISRNRLIVTSIDDKKSGGFEEKQPSVPLRALADAVGRLINRSRKLPF